MKDGTIWKLISALLVVATVAATLFGGIGERLIFRPQLVYDVVEMDTIFGPKMQLEVATALQKQMIRALMKSAGILDSEGVAEWNARSSDAESLDEGHLTETNDAGPDLDRLTAAISTWQISMLKEKLLAHDLFPDRYARLSVTNRGRGPARDVRVALRTPGVVIEHTAGYLGYPRLKGELIKAIDDAVPMGVEVREVHVPRLVPGETLTVEVWYAEYPAPAAWQGVFPDWPKELEVVVSDADRLGRTAEEVAAAQERWALFAVVVLLVILSTAVLASIRALNLALDKLSRSPRPSGRRTGKVSPGRPTSRLPFNEALLRAERTPRRRATDLPENDEEI